MAKAGAQPKRVLILDDDPRLGKFLAELMEKMGYQTLLRGAHDLHLLTEEDAAADLGIINLAVLGSDLRSIAEELDRLDLLQRKSLPLLALTSLNLSPEVVDRLARLGLDELLAQDSSGMEMVFAVNRLLFPKLRELRRYTRVFGGFPVEFKENETWRVGEAYNLSQEGAFVQCQQPPVVESRLLIRLVLPDTQATIEGLALVVWVNQAENDSFTPAGMGVTFLTMNDQGDTRLRSFLLGRINENVPAA